MTDPGLAGRTILVAEDEYFIAADLRSDLTRLGATVIGPAPSLCHTLHLIASTPLIDGAILDINLAGELVFPAAEALAERGIPFLFATGYDRVIIPTRFSHIVRCEKPVGVEVIERRLAAMIVQA